MIINKAFKIIFVKTKKTAGTSFEIALSKFCDADDIITPVTPKDEQLRYSLGFKCAQNYKRYFWRDFRFQAKGKYYNHIPLVSIKNLVPNAIFNDYRKITIYRNPFDVAISRYYWEGGLKTGLNFFEYIQAYTSHLRENSYIAPIYGNIKCDIFLRYESLQEDMKANGLEDVWDVFKDIRAKSDKRPKVGATVSEVYRNFPGAIEIIQEQCISEIEFFKYPSPF